MKAAVFTAFGSPDVLRLVEIEKPVPDDNRVLVKVHAALAEVGQIAGQWWAASPRD